MHTDHDVLARLDKEHVWHPYTQMAEYNEKDPLVIVEGEGRKLKDAKGRWYYDGTSSIWLNVHGHRVPEIDAAIIEQLGKVAHSTLLGQANEPSVVLAKELVKLAPDGLTRVFYSDSGSEAVEAAIKMALQYWANLAGRETRRHRILSFEDGYHGDTLGAVAAAPVETFHWPFKAMLPSALRAPFPNLYRSEEPTPERVVRASLEVVERLFEEHPGEVAAVIVEAMMQGVAGIVVAPEGFLKGLSELCEEHGVLLIADEVATGFGRTGTLFACEHESVTPDLMAVGKGLTGGYLPLAATLTTNDVYGAFLGSHAEKKTFFHGHSYTGNQLGCAAALGNLERMRETRLIGSLAEKERLISERAEAMREHPYVGDVRYKGMVLGIEFVADKETKTTYPWEAQVGWRVCNRAREKGLLVRPLGSVVIFMPPLGSTLEELSEMLDILTGSLWEATEEISNLAEKVLSGAYRAGSPA
ncbi:MAG: adenosylmethionine---8-amino-7-oxononanoate aminotransferase [Rubrobacteraceae bacterium]|nr:adenosylmethionine---8-amino-7-oxononanoate aminotransferase [Rubrobacteraceae bacterium]